MSFTEDDLKQVQKLAKTTRGSMDSFIKLPALLARLEAAEKCAYDLEGICEVECPDCGKELDDPHEQHCETGESLRTWRKSKGEASK